MYLSELVSLPGVSGDEGAVRRYIKEKLLPYADRVEVDPMGNLLAFKKGTVCPDKTLMLCAHMDEVGLIVSRITEEGFIKFKTVGGIDPRVLVSKRILAGSGGISGVIGRKAIHLLSPEERKQAPKIKDLYVDIGAKNKKDAEKKLSIGDCMVFDSPYRPFGEGLVKSRALDDRAGCAVLLSLLKESCPWNLCLAFTVQEEVGLRGAKVCAKRIRPDLAVVLEATTCSDLSGIEEKMFSTRLGGGAALSFLDGSTSYDRELVGRVYELAKKKAIPVQMKQTATGGNDAGAIHTAGGGIRTVSISIPTRYIHSPASVLALKDYEAVLSLAKALVEEVQDV